MTAAPTPVAEHPSQPVRSAAGLLGRFNSAGVLGYADVHVVSRLRRLGGEPDEDVLLAAALAVRGVRHGSVCLPLAEAASQTAVDGLDPADVAALPWPEPRRWLAAVERSPLVAVGVDGPADRPLRLVDGLLYLDRYWRQERVVALYVDTAMLASPDQPDPARLAAALRRLFPEPGADRQRLAAAVTVYRRFSILAGGPGTGKTWTVARLLALLQDLAGGGLRVALAAPTGKAAARLTELVAEAASGLDGHDRERVGALTASTLHRLLGARPDARTRFRHNRENRLPYDLVVVDEASMVSLTMMSRLLDALRPHARLVLVGDPNQLSSVEVGAVLGDLVRREPPAGVAVVAGLPEPVERDLADLTEPERNPALTAGIVALTKVRRYSEQIQQLAEAIRQESPEELAAVLDRGHDAIEFVEGDPADPGFRCPSLQRDAADAGRDLVDAARAGDAPAALAALGRHRMLCAHRVGPYGVAWWSRQVEEWVAETTDGYSAEGPWYVGRPLLVTANDYQLRLFNGDTGVVVADHGQARAAFRRDRGVELFAPNRLSEVQTVHAMSVHRSQGSQFRSVSLVLPPLGSPLLTQELVYTAVTRAQHHVRIIGSREALMAAVQRPVRRASGLRRRPTG